MPTKHKITLTEKQRAIFNYILEYRDEHQTLPSRADIQRGLEYKHYPSVISHMTALTKKGYIVKSTNNVGYKLAKAFINVQRTELQSEGDQQDG